MCHHAFVRAYGCNKYALIWGGVQKNVGPAGVVIAIIRDDLVTDDVLEGTPSMLRYKIHADNKSLYNYTSDIQYFIFAVRYLNGLNLLADWPQ